MASPVQIFAQISHLFSKDLIIKIQSGGGIKHEKFKLTKIKLS